MAISETFESNFGSGASTDLELLKTKPYAAGEITAAILI